VNDTARHWNAWQGMAFIFLGAAAAVVVGCGSHAPSPGEEAPLLVRLEVLIAHHGGTYGVEVDQAGRCTAVSQQSFYGPPVGYFELALGRVELERLKAAVQQAEASLPDPFVPRPGPPESTMSRLTLQSGDRPRTVEFYSQRLYVPRALRPLHHLNGPTLRDAGLLGSILRRTWQHPTHAIALYAHTPRIQYRRGEPIPIQLVVRSIGAEVAAVPTLECREIVSGQVWVSDRRSGDGWTATFGGEREQPPLDRLTPRARRDLATVAKLPPAAGYGFAFPRTVQAGRRGERQLAVGLITAPRYTAEVLDRAIGTRLVTGSLVAAPLTVEVGD